MRAKADSVTMQVLRYALEQIADEMGHTLVRTSRSTIIKEIMDISCAVFDGKGRTIAQAHHAPMLLTAFEITMQEVIRRFPPERLRDGDVIASNDPYLGGQHLMDLQLFAPVFFRKELVGWVGAIAHQQDMGGAVPGGVAGGMTEIYMEGLRLPMVKLYKAGKEDPELFALIASNIRIPDKTLGDIRAQASCCFVGVRRLKEVVAGYGLDVFAKCTAMLLDYSEGRIRESLRRFPDGTFTGEDWIDNDGVTDQPIKIQVNIDKRGAEATVDFEGTAEQATGNINCPVATTHAAVYYALIALTDPHCPPNSGCYRPFRIRAREGLIVNPKMPAAVAARTNTSQKIVEAMMKAFVGVVPERVMAGSHGQISTMAFSGFHRKNSKRFVYTDIQGGGAGARPGKDGRDGQDSHLARFRNTPIEAAELEYPIRVERYELIPDSSGAGRWRGALALRRDIRCLIDRITLARYGDRQEFPPFGLLGGGEGARGRFLLNPERQDGRRLKSKGVETLAKDDLVSMRLPGGGGYGPPWERDPELVVLDVRDGKVSVEVAAREYRVAVDPVTLKIDAEGCGVPHAARPGSNQTAGAQAPGRRRVMRRGEKQLKGMTRRRFLAGTASGTAALALPWGRLAWAQRKTSVTIAFPEAITSMDPQPGSRNMPRETFYQAVFDRYRFQDRQLNYHGGIVEALQYTNPEKTAMEMKVRQGVSFHDGSPLTADDVAFSLNRMRETPPYSVVYRSIASIEVPDKTSVRLKFAAYNPAFTKWLGFLSGFVIPKAAFEKAGAEGFARSPVGSGPYRVVRFVPGTLLVLDAFDKYWRGAPPIKRATIKVVSDPTARVAEILSGDADITVEVPVEEYARLAIQPGLKGVKQPVTDVATIFVSPRFEPFQKEEVRLAVHHAIDKKTLVDKVLLGFGIPVSTTEAPLYDAHTDFSFPFDPDRARQLLAKAGYSRSNPVRLKVMTTKGAKTKDFEVMSAIGQMWKDVGIEAELEIVTIPQWFQHRNAKTVAPLSLYFWSNATGDPVNSVGFMTRNKGPFKVWESPDVDPKVDPIFTEIDERKRIAAAKEAARYVAERGYIIPLYQVVMPVIMKKDLQFEPYPQGLVLPQEMSWA